MKRHIVRDFWVVLLLCYGVIGISLIRAEETGVARATALLNEGKSAQAIEILTREVTQNPQAADAQVILGLAYLQQSNFVAARSAFEKAVSLKPDLAPAHYNLAMLYERAGENAPALEAWKNVLRLASDQNLKNLADKHIRHLEGKQ